MHSYRLHINNNSCIMYFVNHGGRHKSATQFILYYIWHTSLSDNLLLNLKDLEVFRTGRRIAPKLCADIGHISSHLKKLTHPTPGGFRGLPIQCHTLRPQSVRAYFRSSPCVLSSYYILDRRTAPSDRTAPKFGTHVRIDSLTLKKNLTHPHPRGV